MKANFDKPNQLLINSYGDILISNNGGASFSVAKHTVNNGAGLIIGGVFWDGANIYIGTNEGLLLSNDKDGKVLCTFSGRRGSNSSFTASSGVFLYDPATNTWSDRSHSGMYYWTKDVVIDPSDPTQNTWYTCVFSGWGGAPNGLGGLYKTTDRGLNWTKLTGSQFDRVSSMSFNPQNTAQAYLTTETQGLWVCQNIHANAPVWTLVNSYPFRQPERVYFNPFNTNEMWVSSFGNGMRVGNFTATATGTPTLNASEIKVYPNPVGDVLHIDLKGHEGLLQVYNATGDLVESKQIFTGITVLSTGNWPEGIYFVKFRERVIKIVRP